MYKTKFHRNGTIEEAEEEVRDADESRLLSDAEDASAQLSAARLWASREYVEEKQAAADAAWAAYWAHKRPECAYWLGVLGGEGK